MPYNKAPVLPPCNKCTGACCRQESSWVDACWLDEDDLANPVIRAKAVQRKRDNVWVLPYKSGKCVFLDGHTNRCKIYDQRPGVCRTFNCRECNEWNQFIASNPLVRAILKETNATKIKSRPKRQLAGQ